MHLLYTVLESCFNNIELPQHAFDSSGRLFNQHGKLETWWSNATSEKFNERQECLAQQYSSYTVDDGKGGVVHVNVRQVKTMLVTL